MKIQYLGTGAAEGIPALFCRCRVCENARTERKREVRTRCQAVIDSDLLLDFGPDTYMHELNNAFGLPDIQTLLVTHGHTDHFYATDLGMRRAGLAHPRPAVLNIYGSQSVEEKFYREFSENVRVLEVNHFHRVECFEAIKHPKYEIIPLHARHGKQEKCLFYSIREKETKKALLYAHDTAVFPEDTWEYLAGMDITYDLVSLDCNSMLGRDGKNHMGLEENIQVAERLKQMGKVREDTIIVLNHFSHNSDVTHEEMVEAVKNTGFLVAYDGMCCQF